MANDVSAENKVKNNNDDFQFLIDNYQLFNQQKAIQIWFEKVRQRAEEPAKYFPDQKSNTYYQQLRKTLRGIKLKKMEPIVDHFRNLYNVSVKQNLDFTIEDLKGCIENDIPSTRPIDNPKKFEKTKNSKIVKIDDKKSNSNNSNNEEIENLITFEEIYDEIGDLSFGENLLEAIEKNLVSKVTQNVSKDIQPFLKDDVGEPRLEFIKTNHRVFRTEFDTDEINDIETVKLIAELSSIFDKRAELQINENGLAKKLSFQTSDERIKSKIRGFEIVNILRKRGIKISLFNDIMSNVALNSGIQKPSEKKIPDVMTITTNINIFTIFTISFGNKEIISPASGNFHRTISNHAKKIAGLIESQISWGRPVK